MNYKTLYILALVVTIFLALWTGISAAGGDKLGIPPIGMAWLTVIAGALGTLNGFLPALQRKPSSYDDPGPMSNPDPMPRDQ